MASDRTDAKTKRAFKGVWIPAVIWLHPELSWLEKALLAEIDSLDDGSGCRATSGHLSKMLGSTKPSIRNMLSKLRKMGLVVDVDGSPDLRRIKVCPLQPTGYGGCNSQVTGVQPGGYRGVQPGGYTELPVEGTNENKASSRKMLIDLWTESFKDRFGTKYSFNGAKDGQAINRLLGLGRTPEEIVAIAVKAWDMNDPKRCWNCAHRSSDLAVFSSAFNAIVVELDQKSQVKPF